MILRAKSTHLASHEKATAAGEPSLQQLPGRPASQGLRCLEPGSGSVRLSLPARQLRAWVRPDGSDGSDGSEGTDTSLWQIEADLVRGADDLASLGLFDFGHSWCVVHHAGEPWRAMRHAVSTGACNELGLEPVR